jgi:branched-chain amino acid transport system substrate-binding protein
MWKCNCAAAHLVQTPLPATLAGCLIARADKAQMKIGVVPDMHGPLSSVPGMGSVDGARMATRDFGGSVLRTPVELVFADRRNAQGCSTSIAR